MNHIYTTLAVGKSYRDNAIKTAKQIASRSDDHIWVIISDVDDIINMGRIYVHPLLRSHKTRNTKYLDHNNFNYNLKYYALSVASTYKEYPVVFYIDSDWRIGTEFCPTKIQNLTKWFIMSDFDFIFERPHLISSGKKNIKNCFWAHKIEPLGLNETKKYDNGHVPNEQFLVFKNNFKFDAFWEAWASYYRLTVEKNVWQFAEGVEIGMSAIDANLNFTWEWPTKEIKKCFEFTDKAGNIHTRF